jgi:hypothetical protein
MAYAHLTELVLSGSGGNPVEANATLYARNPSKNTGASLALAIAETINFSKGKLYLDAVSGTMGTTQVTGTWLDFNLTINTGLNRQDTGDGSLDFNHTYLGVPEIMLDTTIEHDANAVSAFDAYQAETPKLLRMLWEGSDLATPGTLYSKKTLMIDLAVKATKWGPIQTRDGNNVVPISYKAAYDETAAKYAEITVVNEVASL